MQPAFSPLTYLRKASKYVPVSPETSAKDEAPCSHKTGIICAGQSSSRTKREANKASIATGAAFPAPAWVTKQNWSCFVEAGAGTAVINQAIIRDLSAGTKYMFQGFNPLRNLGMENLSSREFIKAASLWMMNAYKKRNFHQAGTMTSLSTASHL